MIASLRGKFTCWYLGLGATALQERIANVVSAIENATLVRCLWCDELALKVTMNPRHEYIPNPLQCGWAQKAWSLSEDWLPWKRAAQNLPFSDMFSIKMAVDLQFLEEPNSCTPLLQASVVEGEGRLQWLRDWRPSLAIRWSLNPLTSRSVEQCSRGSTGLKLFYISIYKYIIIIRISTYLYMYIYISTVYNKTMYSNISNQLDDRNPNVSNTVTQLRSSDWSASSWKTPFSQPNPSCAGWMAPAAWCQA